MGRSYMKRIYVIGDSISMQYGPYLETYLMGKMLYARKTEAEAAALDLDPPQGGNGGDSSMVLAFAKAKAAVGGFDTDWLLLNCGLWDLRTNPQTGAKQVPLDQYRVNLREILSIAHAQGVTPIWARTTPCDEAVHNKPDSEFHRFAADAVAYNETADVIMKVHSVPVIDLYTFTQNLGEDLYYDHVHFHEYVREKQGAFIAGWLTAWEVACRAQER
jgi:lysophospholipase L1-like esterase